LKGGKQVEADIENLEEQRLIVRNENNKELIRLTNKGHEEVKRWRKKNWQMDTLLFLFRRGHNKFVDLLEIR
jgi:DNA-binding PadR family transcriptional regulator